MPNDATSATVTAGNLPPFALPQSVFMISLASNVLFGQTLDLQKKINDYLGVAGQAEGEFFQKMNTPNPLYQCLTPPSSNDTPDWQTAWGPAVFRAKFNPGATNAIFVAYSAGLMTYVVAIAGTNPLGANALLFQDLDVLPKNMKAWPPTQTSDTPPQLSWTSAPNPASTQPALAEGTSEGLERLFELEAVSSTSPKTPVTLQAFLKGVEDPEATLIFTGHSLGGALSPMLALLLYPQPSVKPSPWQNVYILPTAGPTPGNQGLADIFKQAYPPQPISVYTPGGKIGGFAQFTFWNKNYANVHDVVPRAWNELSGLVTQPARPLLEWWPSFFAGGARLAPVSRIVHVEALGPYAAGLVDKMTTRAGYSGGETPYYVPAVQQVTFTGQWGKWNKHAGYPWSWDPKTPPEKLWTMLGLGSYILNAHLSQYPFAFLGASTPAPAHAKGDVFDGVDEPADAAEAEAETGTADAATKDEKLPHTV